MKRIAFFVSGNGGNMENLIREIKNGQINANPSVVVCDNPNALAIERAKKLGVEVCVIDRKNMPDRHSFEERVVECLQRNKIDLIMLAGFMRILSQDFVKKYWGKIVNIHPSLLPDFPGAHAIFDVFEAKKDVTGVTVHFVDLGVDTGPIILQKKIRVLPEDTLESLEEKIHKIEHEIYPEALKLVLSGSAKQQSL